MSIVITDVQKAIVSGSLLGDATLVKRINSYRIRFLHCEAQKCYVYWKHEKLKSLCLTTQPPRLVMHKKKYSQYEFYTSSGLHLKPFHDAFFKPQVDESGNVKYVRSITEDTLNFLPKSPLVLAVLFLDDGSVRNDAYSGKIATQCFTEEEHLLLQAYLKDVYGLNTVINKHKHQKYLAVNAADFGNLIDMIEPIVNEIPCMMYKLNALRKERSKYFS